MTIIFLFMCGSNHIKRAIFFSTNAFYFLCHPSVFFNIFCFALLLFLLILLFQDFIFFHWTWLDYIFLSSWLILVCSIFPVFVSKCFSYRKIVKDKEYYLLILIFLISSINEECFIKVFEKVKSNLLNIFIFYLLFFYNFYGVTIIFR